MATRPHRKLRLVEPGPEALVGEATDPRSRSVVGEARDDAARPSEDVRPAQEVQPAPGRSAVATGLAASGPLDDLPDAQLVAMGCAGDTRALERLYRRHAAFAIHLAARIEGSARDVEDIAHDAFLRAFERLGDLTDRAAFKSWLGAIVVHAVRSRMRRARLLALLGMGKSAEPIDLDAIASSDASPHTRAQIAQIYALLRTLPADERIAWILRSVEGHDLESVARMTRCSLATVKRRISRTQKFLEEHFVSPEADDDPPASALRPSASASRDSS